MCECVCSGFLICQFQARFNFSFQVADLARKWVGIRKVKAAILKTVFFKYQVSGRFFRIKG